MSLSPSSMTLSGKITLLGIEAEIKNAAIASKGFTFRLSGQASSGKYDLSCHLDNDRNLSVNGSFLQLDSDIALNAPGTSLSLGTLYLDSVFSGSLTVAAGDSPDATVGGSFEWNGASYSLSDFTLSSIPGSLADLRTQIQDRIKSEANPLFGPNFSNPTDWLSACKNGLLQAASDAADVLTEFYHKAVDEAADLLKKTGVHANANLHQDRVLSHTDVAPVHTDERGEHTDHADHTDASGPHADERGEHADVGHADDRPHNDSSGPHGDSHTDRFHAHHHSDHSGPHSDGSGPHSDTPHADNTPHTDGAGPHTDNTVPHADNTPHTDANNPPEHGDKTEHQDETRHVDTP